ncbi:Protein of unknown function [Cribrihabitans marinus]|uniref:DUF2927 domain-containing protein n=1 Tax=Cribrihabitans marinus TaxID=1227549 RepID=A0A1H7A5R2_9RHOB|nr:DUF2927 domain-containing protein [Cribrihabitans marinus]GGH29623.1 hypothetical protein GCM10010973_19200 [Cribrihabitans marinus]SEJ59247.1 Protein of unknown function [Cribrihabitans marinus]
MRRARSIPGRAAALLATLAILSACEPLGPATSPVPQPRPAGLGPAGDAVTPQSAASRDLARYYEKVQNDLLTRGLLRTDGGGPDAPFDADDLARNFETIAFFDEYAKGGFGTSGRGASGQLSRWSGPVRVNAEFGPSVPRDQRESDRARIDAYAARLGRLTGHPITATERGGNFHVLVAGEDDKAYVKSRLRRLIPSISAEELALFDNLPRSFYCLVVAVSGGGSSYNYTRAVALIRAEHPELVRRSCIHEEIAQGLGLPNDSPAARPSIFNDDDEFALLTSHDEMLLRMLYDDRLKQGMSADEARPVTRIIARELMGQPL